MATNIPPHNLTEIVTAAIVLVEKPKTQLERILTIVQGPDFPTAGFIHGRKGLHEAYRTGRGRFLMRAKVRVEHLTKESDAIIVTEIPYQVNKARLIERIADLVNEKTIEEISDIRDESDRDGMRIVIELKRGSQPEIVLNQLYKHTQMQDSFSMIFLAVVNNQPREMGLVQALQYFIDHRVDVIRRRTAFLLQKAKDRAHILEGYQKALDYLDHVIAIIRGSQNRAEARENLVAYFGGKTITINLTGRFPEADPENPFSTKQADAILELQLHRLTRLSIDEIVNELNEQRERIAEYELILGFGEEAALGDRGRAERDSQRLRRPGEGPTAHHHPGRSERAATGRPDRRRAGGGDGEPCGLPEAHQRLDLPAAAARRHRTQGHEHPRRRFRGAHDRGDHA